MNRFLDVILGWPGVIVFCVLIVVLAALEPRIDSERITCEARGGKMVQTIKLYRTCKVPVSK